MHFICELPRKNGCVNNNVLVSLFQSIQFHESGKKHKENVAKRLSEISKKSAKDAKQQLQMDKEIQKMEEVYFFTIVFAAQFGVKFVKLLLINFIILLIAGCIESLHERYTGDWRLYFSACA